MELCFDALRLQLAPELGGSVAGLWLANEPILRCTAQLNSARNSACYPLVPYSNRIAYRQFDWQGQSYSTAANFGDNPHSLHGSGWLQAWQVKTQQTNACTLRLQHQPNADWPFAFAAEQTFALSANALDMQISMQNTDHRAQPAGLGLHPFFVRRPQSQLHIAVKSRWDNAANELPVAEVLQSHIAGHVAHMRYDNCFTGWAGLAELDDELFHIQLTGNTEYLVVYTPAGKDYFCVEPVSHRSDAIHTEQPATWGLQTLLPGQSMSVSMRLSIQAK